MKAILFVLCLLPLALASAQYRAEIRQEHWAFQAGPGNEWEGELFADLFENEVLIPDNPSLSYKWFYKFPEWSEFLLFSTAYKVDREGIVTGSYRDYYVEIYDGSGLLATSDERRITTPSPKQVTMYMLREDASTASGSTLHFWSYPRNWHPTKITNPGGVLPLRLEGGEVLNVRPDVFSTEDERYHRWETNEGVIVRRNHDQFQISHTTDDIIAYYRTFRTDALINNYLIDNASTTGGFVEYKDPWLVDTTDIQFYHDPYGYRNLAMGAPFKSDPQPIQPNATNKYKGVFLDQDPNITPVYYSVRAPLSKDANGFTWYFQNWQTSGGVSLQQVGSNPSGYDQKAAIFTGANAVITARYKAHLGSSLATATSTNSQRKFMADEADFEIRSAFVYESANQVWLGDGFNGYVEQLVSMGTDAYSMPSLLVANGGMVLYWHEALDTLG